jgi:hypothetical protein
MKYDTEDLSKTLDKLDAALSKSEPEQEATAADLVKSLTDVAKGAIDLASERKTKKRAKKEAEQTALAIAREDKDDDEDDDEKEDQLPHWLKDKVDDGKAAGEMKFAGDHEDYGHDYSENAGHESRQMGKNIGHMGKSVQIGDQEVYDVGDYLARSTREQAAMAKSLNHLLRLHKSMINGLVEIEQRLQQLEAQNDEQARFTGLCAKALRFILDHRDTSLDQPVTGSRFASMEKSIVLAQRQIDADGGTMFPMTARTSNPDEVFQVTTNKERLSKAVLTGKITPAQATYIKKTERLPSGVSLN